MKDLVIVLGKNYSTSLGIIRALGQKGYTIDLYYVTDVKGASRIAASSRYLRRTIEHIGRTDEAIIDELLAEYWDRDTRYVLMPTDDYSSSLIDRFRDRLKGHFFLPFVENDAPGSIMGLMNKAFQQKAAASFGLDTAKTFEVYLPSDGDIVIPEGVVFPCIVKPEISARGFKTEIAKCGDRKSLGSRLSVMRDRMSDRTVLVQEFLNIVEEYAISGACVDQDVIMPALIKKIEVGRHETGVTILGRISAFDEIGEIKGRLEEMMKSFHYTGLWDIDLFRDKDRIYFGEINFRSSGIGYSVIKAGADLPDLIVKALLGEDYSSVSRKAEEGLLFFYDKTGWEDVVFGDRTMAEVAELKSRADFSLIDVSDDPKPGSMLMAEIRRQSRRHALMSFFHIYGFRRAFRKLKGIR